MSDKRNFKLNVKISALEKEELNRIMKEKQKSLSDIVRNAIKSTYDVCYFEQSYELNTCIFNNKRKSIFD